MGVSGWNIERLILSPHVPPPLLGSGLGSGCISWQPELTHCHAHPDQWYPQACSKDTEGFIVSISQTGSRGMRGEISCPGARKLQIWVHSPNCVPVLLGSSCMLPTTYESNLGIIVYSSSIF